MECNSRVELKFDRVRFRVMKFGFRSNYFLEVGSPYTSSVLYSGSTCYFRVPDDFDLEDLQDFEPVWKDRHHCEGFKHLTMITTDGITHNPLDTLPFPPSNYLFVDDLLEVAQTVGMTIPELTRETLKPFITQVKQKVRDNHEPLFEDVVTELRKDLDDSRRKIDELKETIKKLESERATHKDEVIAKMKEFISKS